MSSGLELKPPSHPPSLADLEDDEARVEAMVEWYRNNYEDPTDHTPYDGGEGGFKYIWGGPALLQRLAAVRGRLSLCADQAAAAKWWLSMPMASVSAEGPMPKALSTRRTSPLMPGCRHQGRACPLRRARMTSNPLIVA